MITRKGAGPSTETEYETVWVICVRVEFTVGGEESLRLEYFGFWITGFISGHGPDQYNEFEHLIHLYEGITLPDIGNDNRVFGNLVSQITIVFCVQMRDSYST